MRRLVRGLLVPLGLIVGLMVSAPSAYAEAVSRMAAAGIDASTLKPGWVLEGENVIWDDGDAILSFGAAASNTCASTYVCLYENVYFDDQNADGVPDGADVVRLRGAVMHYMTWYGFNDKMSSWKNYSAVGVLWYKDAPPPGDERGRCMMSGFSNSFEPWGQNDVMSALYIYPAKPGCLY